ncbi:MAG: prolyl oligopeptidase family serine peptidase, partial [Planctomycetota bacterium]
IRARLEKIWNFERYGAPRVFGGRAFFTRNDGLQNQSVLYVQDSPESEPRVLLDPNTLSEDGTVSIANWQPSFDGTKLGYSISVGGSDWKTIRIRDVLTTVDEPEVLEWCKFTSPSWSADSRGFYYSRYDKPAEGTELSGVNSNVKMHFHTVGTPQSEDPLLYERPDHPKWGFGGWETEDGLWNLVWVWEGSQPRNRIYARDLMDPDGKIEPVLDAFDARYDPVANDGSVLYVFTDKGAPRGRILAIDMKNPAESAWKELVPQREETLDDVKVVDNRFLCIYMRDAHTVVRVHALDGTFERELELPGTGTASAFTGRRGDKHTYYRYTDFGTPSSTYRCEVATGLSELFRAPVVDFDGSRLVTEQVWFKSRDGVKVPMFLTRRWDVEPNGNRPVYLYAYGGFGISMTPFFSISNAVWLERGGILAIPNLRGGGEYGKDWHQAATGPHRQKSFDDFQAAAEYLVDSGWTRPGRIAIAGGSNGGLLVGACMTQRPELYGACLPAVGVMDMLRFHKFTIGWAWVPEFGSSDDAEQFKVLRKYSPLHNLRPGTSYPPTMVTTADHDDRVVPAHSFKFAARLQECQAGPAPVLIRIETKAGHGAGTPTSKRIDQAADRLAFLVEVLNLRD